MSRSLANHHLHLARLLLDAWARDASAESVPATTLQQAFYPGVREQLITAYGWFLCAVLDPTTEAGGAPPRSAAELPEPVPGKAVPGEIREFQLLEREGWLADLLAEPPQNPPPRRQQPSGLLGVSSPMPTLAETQTWRCNLQAFFDRMNDSLDEC